MTHQIRLLTACVGIWLFFAMGMPVQAANFTAGDAAALIQAINDANTNSGADTITLTADITLTASNNTTDGNNGLPVISTEITINGAGFTIARDSSADTFRIFYVNGSATLTLNNVTLSDGVAANTDVTTTFDERGGGILNLGALTVGNSTLSGNNAGFEGGGIYNNDGTVTVNNSTLSGNNANFGGGISNQFGTVTVSNSTLSGNNTNLGGGIFNGGGTVTVSNSTLSGNNALIGGGIFNDFGSTLTLSNSIIADSTGSGCINSGGSFTGNDNLDNDGTCPGTTGTITPGTDYDTTLADNGGPTLTHALLNSTNNPAIDASGTGATSDDQRGAPAVNMRDIGAYEFNGDVPTVSFSIDQTTLTEGSSITQATVTFTVTNYNAAFDVLFAFTGDAIASDYTTTYSGPYTINSDGDTTFTIDIVNDALIEGTETLTLEMQIVGTADIASPNPQSITFEDSLVTLTASDDVASENPADNGQFTVDLGGVNTTGNPITVNYSVGGSATPTDDYTALSGSVTIPDGQQTATIDVIPVDDNEAEGAETVELTLTDTDFTGLNVDAAPATVTIQDDDGVGVLVQPLNVTFGAGNSGFYTVVLTSQPSTDVTVTAFANSVCEMFPGTRTFTPRNWNQPQEFAVGSTLAGECLITHSVTSAGAYDGISATDVRVTVTDGTGETAPGDDSTDLTDDNPLAGVEELPTTGETPFWRGWLIALLVIGVGLATATGVVLRRQS